MSGETSVTSAVDPTQLEVIRNALESIADEMAITLYRTSRSVGVRLGWDFSTAVLTPEGDLVGQGMCHPIHLGGMMPALKGCLSYFGGRVQPGDVLITNDPYEGAQHLPDIYLFKPVYRENALVGFVGAICHHRRYRRSGAWRSGFDNREIFQEGLRIPPLKLYEQGRPNETLFRLIERRCASRGTSLVICKPQKTSLGLGERQLSALVDRHGVQRYRALVEALIDHTEQLTRRAIAALPDGTWTFTDYVDDDGISDTLIAIVATFLKQGDSIHVDFSGTSPQCEGSITGLLHMNESWVHMALRSMLSPDLPSTAGFFRPITIAAPPGSFVNPRAPAAVGARSVGGRRINQAVWGALAQMAPDRVFGCPGGADAGMNMTGLDRRDNPWRHWVLTEGFNEIACGGRPDKDGMEGQGSNVTNQANAPDRDPRARVSAAHPRVWLHAGHRRPGKVSRRPRAGPPLPVPGRRHPGPGCARTAGRPPPGVSSAGEPHLGPLSTCTTATGSPRFRGNRRSLCTEVTSCIRNGAGAAATVNRYPADPKTFFGT